MKLGQKLIASFTVLIVISGIVGAIGYMNMNNVAQVLYEVTLQRIPSVRHATEVERFALRTILEEKQYLLYQTSDHHDAAMSNIAEIFKALDAVDTVANQYNDQELLSRSKEVRQVTEEYRNLYNEGVANLQKNKQAAEVMNERGAIVVDQAKLYFDSKIKDDSEAARQTLPIVVSIWATALETRQNEKNYMLYKDAAEYAALETNIASLDKLYNDLEAVSTTSEDKAKIATARTATKEYYNAAQDWVANDNELKGDLARMQEIGLKVQENALAAQNAGWAAADISRETATTAISTAIALTIAVVVAATIIGFIIAIMMSRNITRPIQLVAEATTRLAQGDLKQTVSISSQDEIGLMANAFNDMASSLRRMIESERQAKEYLEQIVKDYVIFAEKVTLGDLTVRLFVNETAGSNDPLTVLGHNLNAMVERLSDITKQIREATANISSASAEILAATTQQASGANQQSAAITQTTSTISEVQAVVEQTYNKAETVAQKARQNNEISLNGQKAVLDTVESMNQIKEKVAGIAENILALSEQTQQIGEITATVNEIASQSNLLALNASVEAARAGEHGKGFAVVAVEVRNLAEQSKQATAQVKTILSEIQRATNMAVMATEEGTKGVDNGVLLTQQTGVTIQQLAQSTSESASAAQMILASAKQQSAGMEQITLAMQNINQATIQSLASTRQTERSAQDLSSVARQMESLVSSYKLN